MKKTIGMLVVLFLVLGCSKKNDSTINTEQVLADTTPPIISVKSYVFETTVGSPINYDNAIALDGVDGPCDVKVIGEVNFNEEGEYYLKYVASDLSGNEAEAAFTVVVKEKKNIDEENQLEEEKEVGCNQENAKSKDQPCEMMLEDTSEMMQIYQDDIGLEKCTIKLEVLQENDVQKEYECVRLLRNDQKLWGYGLKEVK